MSLNAFSQIATDTTKIQLSKPIARFVIKDLIKFDGLDEEVEALRILLNETTGKLDTQTKISTNLSTQLLNYKSILEQKNKQLKTSEELSLELQLEVKKLDLQKKIFKIGGITIGAIAILSAIQ